MSNIFKIKNILLLSLILISLCYTNNTGYQTLGTQLLDSIWNFHVPKYANLFNTLINNPEVNTDVINRN